MAWVSVAGEFAHFEWDEKKRWINIQQHGIDFRDAVLIFDGDVAVVRSDRGPEHRRRAIGMLHGREICVVYTERNNGCRIISARRARIQERRAYRALHPPGA